MGNHKTSANSPGPKWLGKAVMKRLGSLALKSCLVTCVAFSATLWGQAADSNQSGAATDPAATTSSPVQHDPAAKGPHADDTYIIGDDDVLAVNVWKEPEISKQIPVRSDGKISLPLVGEVLAAGRTPPQLEQEITTRLRGYITDPQVTVIVEQMNSQRFNIFGQVGKPGSYALIAGITIVDALANAGGLRDFAKKKSIYVLRQKPGGGETRIPFNYEKFIKGKDVNQNIQIKQHDTIVVP